MATEEQLRAALARITTAEKQLTLADRGWQLLGRSRAAFISSLRHTGLSYAHAQMKFDDFVEEQRRLYEYLTQALEAAQRDYAALQGGGGGTPDASTQSETQPATAPPAASLAAQHTSPPTAATTARNPAPQSMRQA